MLSVLGYRLLGLRVADEKGARPPLKFGSVWREDKSGRRASPPGAMFRFSSETTITRSECAALAVLPASFLFSRRFFGAERSVMGRFVGVYGAVRRWFIAKRFLRGAHAHFNPPTCVGPKLPGTPGSSFSPFPFHHPPPQPHPRLEWLTIERKGEEAAILTTRLRLQLPLIALWHRLAALRYCT